MPPNINTGNLPNSNQTRIKSEIPQAAYAALEKAKAAYQNALLNSQIKTFSLGGKLNS